MDGILNLDKPYGLTSMDVVRRIKRAGGLKRVGHGGTLDPVATGVVPICLGQATRMMEYLVEGTKEYRAVIELGVATDTYDALGKETSRVDALHVAEADVEGALESFKGAIQQVPPMYSALKRGGKRLYELARAGIEVEREPRHVEVYKVVMIDWSPPLASVEVTCGRGLYMRSLAHDLGQALGCGGHLKTLVRLRTGPFEISEALCLGDIERRLAEGDWKEALYAPDVVLQHLRAMVVGRRVEGMVNHGQSLPPDPRLASPRPDERCRVYSVDGRFLAVAAFHASSGQWRPQKVFSIDYSGAD